MSELISKEPTTSELRPISHTDFNEFVKGSGVKRRHDYNLTELKAMFGFRPMAKGSSVTLSSNLLEPTRYDSISRASTSTGIPYSTLLYAKRTLNINLPLLE